MKKRMISVLLCLMLVICVLPVPGIAAQKNTDIVILYENDVHCAVEGYVKLAAMKEELLQEYEHVAVVSVGDFAQGGSMGAISQGSYIVELMNAVGYDALALGNHEFDYRLPRLAELVALMDTKPVCCNFREIGSDEAVFAPYSLIAYGDIQIAYIGITTPSTLTSSSPAQFLDEEGNYAYSFCAEELYTVVQETIDRALTEGADYVVALSHVGYAETGQQEDVVDLIENTAGFDVVLDGHSHSRIENMTVTDREGGEVLLSSTGSRFAYIGRLTIGEDSLETELIPVETYEKTDETVSSLLARMEEEYSILGQRKVGFSEVDLITHDADGNRLVRIGETNLGDLCADAFRWVTGADIAYVNGGGIRSDMSAGDLTFQDLLDVFPFNNVVAVSEVSGQVLLDMLEMCLMSWPEEDGAFPHVSGIRFSVDTSIASSVTMDPEEMFTGVAGPYRVYDVQVWNEELGAYEPMDPEETYTLATQTYFLLEYGSGMKMLEDSVLVQNHGMLDLEVLEIYLLEHLEGTVGQEYGQVSPNITFTEGRTAVRPEPKRTEIQPEAQTPSKAPATQPEAQAEPEVQESRTGMLLMAGLVIIAAGAVLIAVKKRRK